MEYINQVGMVTRLVLLAFGLVAASQLGATTVNVDCNKGGAVRRTLSRLKPGDVVLLHGTCRENVVIQPEIPRFTLDGQGKATIEAPDEREPAIQILAREITIKGVTVTGGSFGISINRGATAAIDGNTVRRVARSGVEVSQNSFARITNNTIEHKRAARDYCAWRRVGPHRRGVHR